MLRERDHIDLRAIAAAVSRAFEAAHEEALEKALRGRRDGTDRDGTSHVSRVTVGAPR